MFLLNDIIGIHRELYGKAGDEVTLISDRGKVLILEGPNGNKFSALADETSYERPDNKIEKSLEPKPMSEQQKKKSQPKKSTPTIQTQLF